MMKRLLASAVSAAIASASLFAAGTDFVPSNATPFGNLLVAPAAAQDAAFEIPVEYHTLENGLKVVLSEDHTVPTTTIAVYYGIGFRIEPRDRTGFAHLFEHMMFQGSKNPRQGGIHQSRQFQWRRPERIDPVRFHQLFRGRTLQ